MEQLGIDVPIYAHMMAEALAMMHWHGEIDANDVEFVLAPPRESTGSMLSNILGDHAVWLLDFDCCRRMSMDEDGADRAVVAFFRNDPYLPRPGQSIWKNFRDKYLSTSFMIGGCYHDGRTRLSNSFIEKAEAYVRLKGDTF
jgi:hypothetical protein